MQCILFNKNWVWKLKEKSCLEVNRKNTHQLSSRCSFFYLCFQIKQSWKYADKIYSHHSKKFGVSETSDYKIWWVA